MDRTGRQEQVGRLASPAGLGQRARDARRGKRNISVDGDLAQRFELSRSRGVLGYIPDTGENLGDDGGRDGRVSVLECPVHGRDEPRFRLGAKIVDPNRRVDQAERHLPPFAHRAQIGLRPTHGTFAGGRHEARNPAAANEFTKGNLHSLSLGSNLRQATGFIKESVVDVDQSLGHRDRLLS
jgi:hypothetical protein